VHAKAKLTLDDSKYGEQVKLLLMKKNELGETDRLKLLKKFYTKSNKIDSRTWKELAVTN